MTSSRLQNLSGQSSPLVEKVRGEISGLAAEFFGMTS